MATNIPGTRLADQVIEGTNVRPSLISSNGLVLEGECTGTPPTTANVFEHGCLLAQTDGTTGIHSRFENIGTTAAPVWESEVQTVQVSLSSAQILALFTTAVTLVAAGGTGVVNVVDSVVFKMIRTSTAYTAANATAIKYATNGSNVVNTLAGTIFSGGAGTSYTVRVPLDISDQTTGIANDAVVIQTATANYTSGTGTAQVTVKYHRVIA